MNLVRLDYEDGRLRGQEADGLDGGVLDRQFSNRIAKMNEKLEHLDGETKR